MFKRTAISLVLLGTTVQAQAGIFDFLFGSDQEQETEQVEQAAPETTQASSTTSMIQQGLALIPLLTQTLGVTDDQASGGMGALLQAAQAILSGTDFSTLANAIPNASALMAMAPETGDDNSLIGSALSAVSESGGNAGTASDQVAQFKALGLSADMIPQFTNTASQFLEQSDNSAASAIISPCRNQVVGNLVRFFIEFQRKIALT